MDLKVERSFLLYFKVGILCIYLMHFYFIVPVNPLCILSNIGYIYRSGSLLLVNDLLTLFQCKNVTVYILVVIYIHVW